MKVTFRNALELEEALKAAQTAHHNLEVGGYLEPNHDWAEWYAGFIFERHTKEN